MGHVHIYCFCPKTAVTLDKFRIGDPEELGNVFLCRGLTRPQDNKENVRRVMSGKVADRPLQKQGERPVIKVALIYLKCFLFSPGIAQGSSQNRNARGC